VNPVEVAQIVVENLDVLLKMTSSEENEKVEEGSSSSSILA
jgi:hypothetical protein